MKGLLKVIFPVSLLLLASCTSSEVEDPRPDWEARNALWFAEVYDTAAEAIAQAKAQYPDGNEWEEHCDWRIYKTLLKSQDVPGAATDYIVCKINERGEDRFPYDDLWSAAYTDSVRLY